MVRSNGGSLALPSKTKLTPEERTHALDVAVSEVHRIKGEMAKGFASGTYDLGKKLMEIYEGKLHLERRDAAGAPRYAGWKEFCRGELGLDGKYALKLMDVSQSFTREEFLKVGPTKLIPLLRIPEQARQDLVKSAPDKPRSQILEEVRAMVGDKVRDTGRAAASAGGANLQQGGRGKANGKAEPTEAKEDQNKITVALVAKRHRVKLYAKGKDERRAKTMADLPKGTMELENGTRMDFLVVKNPKGELELVIDVRRNAP